MQTEERTIHRTTYTLSHKETQAMVVEWLRGQFKNNELPEAHDIARIEITAAGLCRISLDRFGE